MDRLTNQKAALQALDQGNYAQAVKLYEELVTDGLHSSHVYYNLGIAYFRSGHVGDSVASFFAAQRLNPRDDDVTANLKFASKAALPKPQIMTAQEACISTGILTFITGLFFLFILARQRVRQLPLVNSHMLKVASLSLLLPMVMGGASFYLYQQDQGYWGAVRIPQLAVHSAPGDKTAVLFELREGEAVLDTGLQTQGYRSIRLTDGRKGWVKEDGLRVFRSF